MTDTEKFEDLKRRVDQLRVRKMAAEAESKRLSAELDRCRAEIREKYGVEAEDFARAIEVMRKEYEEKSARLLSLVEEAEERLKEAR